MFFVALTFTELGTSATVYRGASRCRPQQTRGPCRLFPLLCSHIACAACGEHTSPFVGDC